MPRVDFTLGYGHNGNIEYPGGMKKNIIIACGQTQIISSAITSSLKQSWETAGTHEMIRPSGRGQMQFTSSALTSSLKQQLEMAGARGIFRPSRNDQMQLIASALTQSLKQHLEMAVVH